jgi:hypothetical protein
MKTKMSDTSRAMYSIWIAAIITAVSCYFVERLSPEHLSLQNIPIIIGALFGAVLAGVFGLREIRSSGRLKAGPREPQLPNELIAVQGSTRLQTFVLLRIDDMYDVHFDASIVKTAKWSELFSKQGAEVAKSVQAQPIFRRFSDSPVAVALR